MTGFCELNPKFRLNFGYFCIYEDFYIMLCLVEHEKSFINSGLGHGFIKLLLSSRNATCNVNATHLGQNMSKIL